MPKTIAEKKASQRERMAASGGATLTVELGPAANKVLQRITNATSETKRATIEAALLFYAGQFPAQRAALLTRTKK